MDKELFQRFLNGETSATTGVKNHLRAITSRVLAAPQWGISGTEKTRALEIQAATEAINSPGDTVLTCATSALLASTNLGLIALRDREALPKGHPDSLTVAREVVGILGEPDKTALTEHLEDCGTCKRHLEMAKGAVNAAFSASAAQASAQEKQVPLQESTLEPQPRTAAKRRVKAKRSAKKKQSRKELHPSLMTRERFSLTSVLIPLIFLLGILGYVGYTRSIETDEERVRRLANLLAPELPPTALADDLDPSSRGAALDMRRGHCESASTRLGLASNNAPSDATLAYYAGLAHLCARHPELSLLYFDRLDDLATERFFGQEWWHTQALILNNRTDEAHARLTIMIEDSHPRAESAEQQIARLRESGL